MRGRAALAGAALLAVSIAAHGSARPSSEQTPLAQEALRPFALHVEDRSPSPAPSLSPVLILIEPTPAMTRPPVKQPEVKAKVEPKATKAPRQGGRSASGVPTYYCKAGSSRCTRGYPDVAGKQMYAAAGPSLRVGDWRGRTVNVTANGKTIQVKLIDWCACGGDHFIDLYYDAFKLLGFPSKATVSW